MSALYNYFRKNLVLSMIEDAINKKSKSLKLTSYEIEEIPNKLFECCEVERLTLRYNKITVLKANIVKLENITTLNIDHNSLTNLPPEIGKLVNLLLLNVSHNPLKKLIPEIGELKKLEILRCNNIDVETLPEELGDLQELETFRARGNKIRQLPKRFTNLKKLSWLTLENNLLNKLPEDMDQLKSLVHLNLNNNELVRLPKSLFRCTQMQYIFLANNMIEDVSFYDHGLMENLEYLDVRENPFILSEPFKQNLKFYPRLKISDSWEPLIEEPSVENRAGISDDADSVQMPETQGNNTPVNTPDEMLVDELDYFSDDWENSCTSSQVDSDDYSDNDLPDHEVLGTFPDICRFLGT